MRTETEWKNYTINASKRIVFYEAVKKAYFNELSLKECEILDSHMELEDMMEALLKLSENEAK